MGSLFGRDLDLSDRKADSNGDGVTDFEDMLNWRDPLSQFHWKDSIAGVVVTEAQRAANIESKKRQEERWRANRERLSPLLNRGVRLAEGSPATLTQSRNERRAYLPAVTEKIREQRAAAERRVAEYRKRRLDEDGVTDLKDEEQGRIVDVIEGQPVRVKGLGSEMTDYFYPQVLWPQPGNPTSLVTGARTGIAMWDLGAVRDSHEQFQIPDPANPEGTLSRVANFTTGQSSHATAVAGVLAGGGDPVESYPVYSTRYPLIENLRENSRGISYEARILARYFEGAQVDFSTFDPDSQVDALGNSVVVGLSNHSYGSNCGWEENVSQTPPWTWHGTPFISQIEDWKFGFYQGGVCDVWDRLVYLKQTVLPVFAAGDDFLDGPGSGVPHYVEGDLTIYTLDRGRDGEDEYDLIIPEGCSKNVLTVASNDDGNVGPTDDGRIKPDLNAASFDYVVSSAGDSAYSELTGSSVATAGVTSILNLLLDFYYETHGTEYPLLASTIKALALGSNNSINGPSFSDGWGSVITESLRDVIKTNGDILHRLQHPFIKEARLEDQGEIVFTVFHEQYNRTKVMVCWTDPPGPVISPVLDSLVGGSPHMTLVNDIDVRITSPQNVVYEPWVMDLSTTVSTGMTGDNFRDNVEEVCIPDDAATGYYTVTITHKKTRVIGGQTFPRHLRDHLGQISYQDVSIFLHDPHFANSGELPFEIPFHIVGWDRTGPDSFYLSFTSVVGGVYRIERSEDLIDWTPDPGEILPNTEVTSVSLTTSSTSASEYFRVRQIR